MVTLVRPSVTMQPLSRVRWSVTGRCSRGWSWSSRLSSGPPQLDLLLFLPPPLLLALLLLEKACLRWPSSVLNHHRTSCRHARFLGLLSQTRVSLVPTRASPKELQTLELFWCLLSGPGPPPSTAWASLRRDPHRGFCQIPSPTLKLRPVCLSRLRLPP